MRFYSAPEFWDFLEAQIMIATRKAGFIRLARTVLGFALVGAVLASFADAHTLANAPVDQTTVGAIAGAAVAAVGKFFHFV
ncbi:MAG: hypothetical protein GC166_14775 [Alphaproteobacteria bacterium]|nr:hypothetical protein [Alphaproteobacteria bacterium]